MDFPKLNIYRPLLNCCTFCLFMTLVPLQVYADKVSSPFSSGPLSPAQIDSIHANLLNEIFISRYLRFFDGTYKEPDRPALFQERSALQGQIPFYSNTDSLYRARLQGLSQECIVKLPYNDKVKNYIDVYVNKRRRQVNVMLALSQYYFPIFEEAMEKEGVPKELKYLAIIESALNPRAVSSAGAAGLWQFMYQTGRMNHLRINSKVDERLDPSKSSAAAARYLKKLYQCFGDWTLAIAAYNCGPGNVNKAIRKAKGKTDFWEIYPFLPRETRGYVPAYIGATYVMNYYQEHGFYPPRDDMPILTDTLMLDQDIDMKQVAEAINIPIQILRDLNPQYKQDIIPGKTDYYSLRLPVNLIAEFLENKDTILMDSTFAGNGLHYAQGGDVTISHRIRKGETLSGIAQKYSVKVNDLMSWNDLKVTVIYPNQLLTIHVNKQKASELGNLSMSRPDPSKTENTGSSAVSITTTHPRNTGTIASAPHGNTTLASNFTDTSFSSSSVINPSLKKETTHASVAKTQKSTVTKTVTYKVRKGDTLYAIWKRHPGSVSNEIITLNHIAKGGSLIYPNQILTIEIH